MIPAAVDAIKLDYMRLHADADYMSFIFQNHFAGRHGSKVDESTLHFFAKLWIIFQFIFAQ